MSAEPHSGPTAEPVADPKADAKGDAEAAVLACSRCDGPVNADDLVEGLAVRIDGLTVCALCIETLSPALRIQINRVRALKGLAVVTYRVARSQHPDHHFYSFTSAGLLLLHRRALVHGTEFVTPDLPANHRPHAPTGGPRPATVQIRSAPERSKLPLYLGLGLAGVVVIGGIVAVALSGGTPTRPTAHAPGETVVRPVTPDAPSPANGNPNTPLATGQTPNQSTAQISNPSHEPVAVPALPLAPDHVVDANAKREVKDYRAQFPDEVAALQAGLADEAAPDVITALERDVLARGRANVERLTRILQQPSLGRRELDDIDAALVKAEPPARPAFADLHQTLADLAEISHNKRALIPATVVTPPNSEPASKPPVVTAVPPPTVPVPAIATPVVPPVAHKPPVAVIHSKVSLWSGELGPKPAVFAEVTDQSTRIPSPWPFFIADVPPRFAAAVKTRTAERKDVFTLQLTFPVEQVRNGGIFVTLHPKIARKELLLTRVDLPAEPAQKLTFADRENWQGFAYRVEDVPGDSVTIQIADVAELSSDPFWLGAAAAISNGDPATLADELSPSPLLTPNPLIDWKPLLESLKAAALGRKLGPKWFDLKTLNTSSIKVLGPSTISAQKLNAALRLRRDMPDVENQVEVVNLRDGNEIRKLFGLKANPGLFNQKVIPATVFLVTDGIEATVAPADWAKHVRAVNELFRSGEAKLPATGFVPVWVVGKLDGSPLSTQAWTMLRTDRSVLMIDLTSAPVEGGESAAKASHDTYHYLAEGISTLMYQLRLVQIVQRSR